MLEVVLLSFYTVMMVLIGLFSLLQLHLTLIHRRNGPVREALAPAIRGQLPFVTIQLPIYNERYVAKRILEYVCEFTYPRDRFEIQVLDDSTDATREILDAEVEAARRRGLSVKLIRRADRAGFKAGALRDALADARGEFVAIFDADFLPRSDFLERTIPWFDAPEVAVVQTRWGYVNENSSLLTRIQAFFLDVHFTVEQGSRTRSGYFANFNGTAGVWRKAAIHDAGGWRADTLTEDTDLSYRAQSRGWTIRYLESYRAPSELPVTLSGFRSQQFRWMKGGAENARLHLRSIWSADLPLGVRIHAGAHLLATSVYLFVLAALALSVPLAFVKNTFIGVEYVHFGMLFFTSTAGLCFVYYRARGTRVATLKGKVQFGWMMALFLVFTLGLALHNGLAALRGWFGESTEFVRTPKYGEHANSSAWARTAYARKALGSIVAVEVAMLLFLVVGIAQGVHADDFGFIPIQVMGVLGLTWVVGLAVTESVRVARGDTQALPAGAVDFALAPREHAIQRVLVEAAEDSTEPQDRRDGSAIVDP